MQEFPMAKSLCTCGHSGDGPNSNHADSIIVRGHGRCLVNFCDCTKFTWKAFMPHFEVLLEKNRRKV